MTDDRCDLLCLDLQVAERLRKQRLRPEEADVAAGKARALCVCDLAWIAERSQTLVSHHVRALRTHGIVRSRREGKMVMYSLTEEGQTVLASVLPAPATRRSRRVHA